MERGAARRAEPAPALAARRLTPRDGRLAAVIDWVDLSGGDTAYDLAAAWFCFPDPSARAAFVDATGETDEATWARARACALSHAIACLSSSADNPRMHAVGEQTLHAVLGGGR